MKETQAKNTHNIIRQTVPSPLWHSARKQIWPIPWCLDTALGIESQLLQLILLHFPSFVLQSHSRLDYCSRNVY